MKNKISKIIPLLLVLLMAGSIAVKSQTIQTERLHDGWQIQSSAHVSANGEVISGKDFKPENWYSATVPGSILGSLVSDSVFKNVFFHRNLENIPTTLFDDPWWYRTTFRLKNLQQGQVVRIQFDGINYRADIWINGHQIASADTVRGGFCQFNLDISPYITDGENVLAVKVTRPGKGDLTLGFVDWNPEPPDHNMGIWRDVQLQITGPVSIDQPFVQTLVDTATLQHAELTVSAVVNNHSAQQIQGELRGTVGNDKVFSQKVFLYPHQAKKIIFTPTQFQQLQIDHPKLWWTHTLGKPNLYGLHLEFVANNQLSDSQHLRFGIRQVSDYITTEGHRGFKLNGKKILIKGGGWVDPMLLNATPDYEEAGIDYAVHMNLNAIRMEGFWGSNQHIYDLCDEKGILVMVGLSCQWEWAHLIGEEAEDKYSAIITPEQNAVAAESWQDQILWLRNHPSIFVWMYGSDKWPRPSLEMKYLGVLKAFDPTRPAVSSAKEVNSVITGPSAVKMRGPYDYVPPDYWYVDTALGGAFGYNTETGPGPQIPVLESLKKMIPADSLWPIGSAWLYHAARGKFHNLTAYNNAMIKRLGKPADLSDYLRKAQYLNYEGMRAMFEAFEANRFKATGIIQWMYNASWPKLWWQLYDYYLIPTGAFYGAQKANEPLHISYNYGKNAIEVMNNTLSEAKNLSAEVNVYAFDLKKPFHKTVPVHSLRGLTTHTVIPLPENLSLGKTWFLSLKLFNAKHTCVSDNFYVLSTQKDILDETKSTWYITPQSQYADLTMLQQLPEVALAVKRTIKQKADTTFLQVKIKNADLHLAFMIHLNAKRNKSQTTIVPVFWDANYFSLLPGEERTISAYYHTKDLQGEQPELVVEGWNIKKQVLK